MEFGTVREAVNFLADRNWALEDLRGVNWHFGEQPE
jgi:hypothetical protein